MDKKQNIFYLIVSAYSEGSSVDSKEYLFEILSLISIHNEIDRFYEINFMWKNSS